MSECELHEGKVVRLKGKSAYVEVERSQQCNGCKCCMFAAKKNVTFRAANEINAAVGETIVLKSPPTKPMTAYLILFALPIVLLLAGLLIAAQIFQNELIVFAFALIGLSMGLLAVLALDRLYYSKKYTFRIVGRKQILKERTK